MNWGFLREKQKNAERVAYHSKYGVGGTALQEYLKVIYPNTNDWVQDKAIPNFLNTDGKRILTLPDFRSESRKLIIEFDGLPHYTNPDVIEKDKKNMSIYTNARYDVVRIPYFVQLTNEVVEIHFGIKVKEPLFPDHIPSISTEWRNTPAYLCPAGIRRMAEVYRKFPQQYEVNLNHLLSTDPEFNEVVLLQHYYDIQIALL